MINFKRVIIPMVLVALLVGGSPRTPAQNMSGTVVERRVKFAKGKTSVTLRGKARYAMSYVYNVRAQKGQHMSVQLKSARGLVTFSLTAPDTQTVENAFGTKDWSGDLSQTGDYSIVVVMNEEKGGNVPYVLAVTVK
jgi:hypothetical protein